LVLPILEEGIIIRVSQQCSSSVDVNVSASVDPVIINDGFWETRAGLLDGILDDYSPVESER
jgi:hypothetical protein